MKISIVTAYYNRRDLLINTLQSITKETYTSELEIIIVDDGSNVENNISDVNELFPTLDIRVLEIKQNFKWWINPCVPYNKGFRMITGDVVIIQNPECLHLGEIIKTVEENIEENKYLVFGCYMINNKQTNEVKLLTNSDTYIDDIKSIITPMNNICVRNPHEESWYQHSKYRNDKLHFCSAMMKSDLDELGGFDERFANGIGYDDREFLIRIARKNMNIISIDDPIVLHQFHTPSVYNPIPTKRNAVLMSTVLREKIIKANE